MKRIHSALLIIGHKIYLIKFNCLSAGRAGTRVPACNILMEYPRHGSQVKRASERALRRPNTPPHCVIPAIIHDNKGISLYRLFLLFIPPSGGRGRASRQLFRIRIGHRAPLELLSFVLIAACDIMLSSFFPIFMLDDGKKTFNET